MAASFLWQPIPESPVLVAPLGRKSSMERPFRLAGGNSGNVSGEQAERRDKRLELLD